MPKIRTQSMFPTTLTIDDAGVEVRVKRMTNAEYDSFAEGLDRWGAPRGVDESAEARRARESQAAAWMREVLDAYLLIVPGEMEHEGREITKGGELVDIYGGRQDVMLRALTLVMLENRLSEAEKKTSPQLRALRHGSPSVLPQMDTGAAPGSIVDAAEPRASAPVAAVMEPSSAGSSGTTDPSC